MHIFRFAKASQEFLTRIKNVKNSLWKKPEENYFFKQDLKITIAIRKSSRFFLQNSGVFSDSSL